MGFPSNNSQTQGTEHSLCVSETQFRKTKNFTSWQKRQSPRALMRGVYNKMPTVSASDIFESEIPSIYINALISYFPFVLATMPAQTREPWLPCIN